MSKRIALCVDREACLDPGIIGLDGETLDGQPWLTVLNRAEDARATIAESQDISEAWVISCEGVEPINLAATLKADRPGLSVRLVAADGGGSLLSRAHTASIDEVMTPAAFVQAYGAAKRGAAPSAQPAQKSAEFDPATSIFLPGYGILENEEPDDGPDDLQTAPAAAPAPETSQAIEVVSSTFLMPVVSGSGGAGKSTISVLSALICANAGLHTLLFDCDLQFGDAVLAVGATDAPTVEDMLARPDTMEKLAQTEGLAVLAAPRRLESADYLSRRIPEVLVAAAARFDVIVANTGSSWSEYHAALLERASAALFLVDQRASSLRACKHALDLCMRCGIATGPFRFVLNRCAKGSLFNSVDVSCALQGNPVLELRDGGRDVEEYMGAGAAAEIISWKDPQELMNLGTIVAVTRPGYDKTKIFYELIKARIPLESFVFL